MKFGGSAVAWNDGVTPSGQAVVDRLDAAVSSRVKNGVGSQFDVDIRSVALVDVVEVTGPGILQALGFELVTSTTATRKLFVRVTVDGVTSAEQEVMSVAAAATTRRRATAFNRRWFLPRGGGGTPFTLDDVNEPVGIEFRSHLKVEARVDGTGNVTSANCYGAVGGV